jgi:hypothetical protein
MAGLQTDDFTGTDTLVPELEKTVDSFRTGRLCFADFTREATAIVRALEAALRKSSVFTLSCDSARAFEPSGNRQVYSQPVSEYGHHRIALLGIHRQFPVPVHDHPGMVSLILLLNGRLHAPQYEITPRRESHILVELASRSDDILEPGDIAIVMAETGSLHGLKPLDNHAVCLTIQLCTEQNRGPRSWYFPLAPNQSCNSALWYRIADKEISYGI